MRELLAESALSSSFMTIVPKKCSYLSGWLESKSESIIFLMSSKNLSISTFPHA